MEMNRFYEVRLELSTGSSHHSRSEMQPSSVTDNDRRDTTSIRVTSHITLALVPLMMVFLRKNEYFLVEAMNSYVISAFHTFMNEHLAVLTTFSISDQ